jgi:hypothetical protein
MQQSSLLRAGSQFREKAQSYHNPIPSNVLSAQHAPRDSEGRQKAACSRRWNAYCQYVKRRVESEGRVLGSGSANGERPAGGK